MQEYNKGLVLGSLFGPHPQEAVSSDPCMDGGVL